jgi:peptidoglycan-associated lipoprotein
MLRFSVLMMKHLQPVAISEELAHLQNNRGKIQMTSLTAKTLRSALLLTLITLSATLATGCTKKQKGDEITPGTDMGMATTGDSDSGQAMGLVSINFPYDSFSLDASAKEKLKNNASIMKDKTTLQIQIEGHCDSRGGVQYNIALGEKRANAVKKYLEGMGVAANRVTTISYGKERLLDTAETEEAHTKNRRANFVITSR